MCTDSMNTFTEGSSSVFSRAQKQPEDFSKRQSWICEKMNKVKWASAGESV